MDGFLDDVKRVESADGVPDGEYHGTWSGHTVKFETHFGAYEGKSTVGVRGANVSCMVQVKCGQFKVTSRDAKMTKPVTISYTDGRTADYDSYEAAVEAIEREYEDAAIGHDGGLIDFGDRTLCWADEASSVDDNGSNAVASIRWAE